MELNILPAHRPRHWSGDLNFILARGWRKTILNGFLIILGNKIFIVSRLKPWAISCSANTHRIAKGEMTWILFRADWIAKITSWLSYESQAMLMSMWMYTRWRDATRFDWLILCRRSCPTNSIEQRPWNSRKPQDRARCKSLNSPINGNYKDGGKRKAIQNPVLGACNPKPDGSCLKNERFERLTNEERVAYGKSYLMILS